MSPADVEGSLSQLRRAYDRALAYVEEVQAAGQLEGHVSRFWAEILAGRANYPGFDDMLLMRRGPTYPMAERRDVEDTAAEAEYAEAARYVAASSVPEDFLAGVEEPAFGCPRSFDIDGRQLTANCLVNAITAHRILAACSLAGISDRPLRVLEIGAGFGQTARLLLERVDVGTYAVCDLPENLFLSAFYLQALFPDRAASFGGGDAGLVFVAPPHAPELHGPFDLILNTYSFQEMTRASVEDYFALARAMLAPDGLLYSLNSHGKDEVEWPSDYPISGFRVERLRAPRRFPFHWNATIPYELVLRPAIDGEEELRPGWLDAIGCAYQLGLGDELDGVCDRIAAGSLETGEAAWLDDLGQLFRTGESTQAHRSTEALQSSGILPAVGFYLAGCLAYAEGSVAEARRLLALAEPDLGASLARVHTGTLLGESVASELAPHLAAQLEATTPGAYAAHMAACLHLQAADRPSRAARRIGPWRTSIRPD